MVTTVAPTIPVEAASSMPTMVTEIPSPPRSEPNINAMASSSVSATLDFSSSTPINTNNGTASRVWLVMVP